MIVTACPALVPEHPFPAVYDTVYVPDAVAVYVLLVAPPIGGPPTYHW